MSLVHGIILLSMTCVLPCVSHAECFYTKEITKKFDQILTEKEFMKLGSSNSDHSFITLDKILGTTVSRPLLVMFWHETCKPCKQEARMIEMIYDHFVKTKKIDFLAFYTHDDSELSKANATKEYKKFYRNLKKFGVRSGQIVPDNYVTSTDALSSVQLYNFLLYYGLMKSNKNRIQTSKYQKWCVQKKKSSLPIPRFILFDRTHRVVLTHEGSLLSSLDNLLSFIDQIKQSL